MKSNVIMYIGLILLILQIAIICNVTAKSSYSDMIQQSVDESLERTMHAIRLDSAEHNDNEMASEKNNLYGAINMNDDAELGEFKEEFLKLLAQNMSSKIDNITVNFFGADKENGVMSIEVIADFSYLGGSRGQVSSYKTMILDKTAK